MSPKFRPPQGRLEAAALPRIVRDLWRARATGILHLWNQDETKRIIFKDGDIAFAATNQEKERLGERLVRTGKIKRSVLDLSFRVMERSNERLGKTVVDLGWVSPMEMQRAVAGQIKDIIYSVFTWHEGDYRFEVTEGDPVADDLQLELQSAEVIYEGASRISDLDAIRTGVGSWNRLLQVADGQRLRIPVTQEDGFILSRIDSKATIGDIIASSPLGEEESLRRIYALLLAGVVESHDSKNPRPELSAEVEPPAEADEETVADEERNFRTRCSHVTRPCSSETTTIVSGSTSTHRGRRFERPTRRSWHRSSPRQRFGTVSVTSRNAWTGCDKRFERPTRY